MKKILFKGNKKRKIIIAVIVIAFIALAIFRIVSSKETVKAVLKEPINVNTTAAELTTIEVTAPLSGRIEAIDQVSLMPTIAGEVLGVYVEVGDYVSKGKTLFKIDAAQIQGSYHQAQSAYNQALISQSQASENLNTAQSNLTRIENLFAEGAVSQVELEQAQNQVKNANTSVNQAAESINQANSSLSVASDALGNAIVTAPIKGYVTEVSLVKGSYAAPGAVAVSIADTSALELNTTLSEYLITKVSPGDSVDIYVKSISDTPFSGKIKTIAPTPGQGKLTYPITISIANSDGQIKSGMFAEVQIVSDKKENVLCIPSESVFIKSGESKVAVLKKNKPVFKNVKTGIDNGTIVEILEGLAVGEVVISSGQQYVTEGEAINVVKAE